MKNVKFTSPKTASFYSYAVYRGNRYSFEVLCLTGEVTAYQPVGGRKVLKEILNTCEEGVTYYWKRLT